MDTVLLYRIIIVSIILIGGITYITIVKRKYRRLLKKEMEEIRMREMERHNRELRRREAETRDFGRWVEAAEVHPTYYEEIRFNRDLDEERKIEPPKHMKRHSIR